MSTPISTALDTSSSQPKSLFPAAIATAIVSFYILFTLLPNSNSLMVKWPWVFLWQVGLMLGPIALLLQLWQRSFQRLGGRLDWLAGAWCAVLLLSATFAQFSHQAFWYGWAAICGIAFLYVVKSWITTPERVRALLCFQGGLTTVFSGSSLIAWYFQTVRPYLQESEALKNYGIERSFDLQTLTLRNWHPIGHQNYVAGYLVLTLPLLLGLALSQQGWRRLAWLASAILSFATLCSTASRGSWFGLGAGLAAFIVLAIWVYPLLRKTLLYTGLAGLVYMVAWGLSSNRIRGFLFSLVHQSASDAPSYRAITNATGWFMGLDHPILGAGLGSVTLMYQKYRPAWAGQEAELTYQLHSTPAQLWAELGLAGACLTLVSCFMLIYMGWCWCRSLSAADRDSPIALSVLSGLAGYGIYAITDYQLDNICISGTLILFTAILVYERQNVAEFIAATQNQVRSRYSGSPRTALVGMGILTAISFWLYPIHRAWMLSSQGFFALQQDDVASFVSTLEQAHQLAPWEPYYPYQLGWNLGEIAYKSEDVQQQQALQQKSIEWFERAITLSPNREFGYSNLGWLLVNIKPEEATAAFKKAAQLVPEKQGIYFALGYSLLKEGKSDLAVQSMLIALLQQPMLITSPIWQSAELTGLYPVVLTELENYVGQQLDASSTENLQRSLYQLSGMVHWWQGQYDLAQESFRHSFSDLNDALLTLTNTQSGDSTSVEVAKILSDNAAIAIWAQLEDSDRLFLKTVTPTSTVPPNWNETLFPQLLQDFQDSAAESPSFHHWVTRSGPSRQRRHQRLGFGAISRHIDGPLPKDFSTVLENTIMADFLAETLLIPAVQKNTEILIEHLHSKSPT